MFDRLVSLLLTVAVVACPVRCDNGVCHYCAVDECGIDKVTDLCILRDAATCCCADSREEKGRDVPRPVESNCQGICGGAVFEKPSEFDCADASVSLPLLDTTESIAIPLTRIREVGVEHYCCSGSKNHGRFVRTLHSSLLT